MIQIQSIKRWFPQLIDNYRNNPLCEALCKFGNDTGILLKRENVWY